MSAYTVYQTRKAGNTEVHLAELSEWILAGGLGNDEDTNTATMAFGDEEDESKGEES